MSWLFLILINLLGALWCVTAHAEKLELTPAAPIAAECAPNLLPISRGKPYEVLAEFVAREGRLPKPTAPGEEKLYQAMTNNVGKGRGTMRFYDRSTIELVRRELFYKNSVLSLMRRLEEDPSAAAEPAVKIWISSLVFWGDDPRPTSSNDGFASLAWAQAARPGEDGSGALEGINLYVAQHGSLPGLGESEFLRERLRHALHTADPVLLQLSPEARRLVRGTDSYHRQRKQFFARLGSAPTPAQRFHATVWWLLEAEPLAPGALTPAGLGAGATPVFVFERKKFE